MHLLPAPLPDPVRRASRDRLSLEIAEDCECRHSAAGRLRIVLGTGSRSSLTAGIRGPDTRARAATSNSPAVLVLGTVFASEDHRLCGSRAVTPPREPGGSLASHRGRYREEAFLGPAYGRGAHDVRERFLRNRPRLECPPGAEEAAPSKGWKYRLPRSDGELEISRSRRSPTRLFFFDTAILNNCCEKIHFSARLLMASAPQSDRRAQGTRGNSRLR